jgi:hypothetical protein
MQRYFKEITEAEKQELLEEIQTIILDDSISREEFIELLDEKGYLLYP